jgi:hypothetical protein
MQHVKMLMLISLPLVLTACGGSNFAEFEKAPPELTAPCQLPVRLPERSLSQAETEVFWGRDRAALRACAERHNLLVLHVQGQTLSH